MIAVPPHAGAKLVLKRFIADLNSTSHSSAKNVLTSAGHFDEFGVAPIWTRKVTPQEKA